MTSAMNELALEASSLVAGSGFVDFGLGYSAALGAMGKLSLQCKLNENLFAGAEGALTYGLFGPRSGKLGGSIIGILGARW